MNPPDTMKYYSTNNSTYLVDLWTAILDGIAPDGGLYMPQRLRQIPPAFFRNLPDLKLKEIAYVVGNTLFGEDLDAKEIKDMVYQGLDFEIPIVNISPDLYALCLYQGPTLSIKDLSARIMARLVEQLIKRRNLKDKVNILAATSGDTGSAVAKAFAGMDNVEVQILYPKSGLSRSQIAQFASLGRNIKPIEVDGTYDQCRIMAYQALSDKELRRDKIVISANSINIARLLPQMIYYFWAYAKLLDKLGKDKVNGKLVFSVPCGNLGNICAGLISVKMGLPAKRFVVANNDNDSFMKFHNGFAEIHKYQLRTEDCGAEHIPSNMSRLFDLLKGDETKVNELLTGISTSDAEMWQAVKSLYDRSNIVFDPHGATCYRALSDSLQTGEVGVFLAPTHPAKYGEQIMANTGIIIEDEKNSLLSDATANSTQPLRIAPTYSAFKSYLLKH